MRWAIISVILVLLLMGLVGTDELTQSTERRWLILDKIPPSECPKTKK